MASSQDAAGSTGEKRAMSGVDRLLGEILRNAVGEAVKAGPLSNKIHRIAADAVETVDARGPEVLQDAGVMTWRYALLGWATWNIGKFVANRRTGSARQPGERQHAKRNTASHGMNLGVPPQPGDCEESPMSERPHNHHPSQTGSDELDERAVRDRAWEISQRPDAGTPEENWRRAQEELQYERRSN